MTFKILFSHFSLPKFTNSGLIGLFLIAPCLASPYLVIGSLRKNKCAQIMLSIFMGLLSICFVPPRADLYRIYLAFFNMEGISLNDVINNFRFDFILPISQYLALNLGFDFEIIRVITMSFPSYLFLKLYNKLSLVYFVNNKLLFLICLLSIPFMEISLGIRHGLAISIISYILLKKYLVGESLSFVDYLLLVIAPCIHFGTIWYSALLFVSPMIPNKLPKIVILLILAICFLAAVYIDDILSVLVFDEASSQVVSHYSTHGSYGERYVFHNFIGSIPEYFAIALTYFFIIVTVLSLPYNKQSKLLYCIIMIWLLTHTLYSINERISNVILVSFPLFYALMKNKLTLVLKLLLLGAALTAIINWRAYTVSNSLYIFYPLPFIITLGYNQQWLKDYVDQFGTLFIYKR